MSASCYRILSPKNSIFLLFVPVIWSKTWITGICISKRVNWFPSRLNSHIYYLDWKIGISDFQNNQIQFHSQNSNSIWLYLFEIFNKIIWKDLDWAWMYSCGTEGNRNEFESSVVILWRGKWLITSTSILNAGSAEGHSPSVTERSLERFTW